MAGNETVRVVVRARPMNKREKDLKCDSCIEVLGDSAQIVIKKPGASGQEGIKSFTFDNVYDEDSTQRAVYDETAAPLVESVLEGYNGTIFAYGQTGCGKTFSMEGVENPKELRGIIPNAFDHIFDVVDADETDKTYLVRASYLEIYNEEIRDLLGDDPRKKCDLKEKKDKSVYVKDLTCGIVKTSEEIDMLMKAGNTNRTVGATLMNQSSSRSHSIFTVTIEMSEERVDQKGKKAQSIRVGKLNLVDLAGSERQGKTGATGDRLKEATKINLSLSALGNVISALVDGKSKHIPYRDSKLTRLLQDSLGGNTKTVMLAAISPADNNYDETLSTLRYANRAKNIKNKPKINEDPKDALIREFQEEIERLKQMMAEGMSLPAATAAAKLPPADPAARANMTTPDPEVNKSTVRTAAEIQAHNKDIQEKFNELELEKERVREQEMEMEDRAYELLQQREDLTEKEKKIHEKVEQEAKERAQKVREKMERRMAEVDAERKRQAEKLKKEKEKYKSEKGTLEEQMKKMQGQLVNRQQEAEAAKEKVKRAAARVKAAERLQQRKLRRAQEKLRKQRAREEMLKNEMEYMQQETELNREEGKYLEDQAEMNEHLIEELRKKCATQETEIKDLQTEFESEREYLLDQIRQQRKEMVLMEQVISAFVPAATIQRIEARARYDDERQEWSIPPGLLPDRRPEVVKLKLPGMPADAVARGRRGSVSNAAGFTLAEMGPLEGLRAASAVPVRNSPTPDDPNARPSSGSVERPRELAGGIRKDLLKVQPRQRSASVAGPGIPRSMIQSATPGSRAHSRPHGRSNLAPQSSMSADSVGNGGGGAAPLPSIHKPPVSELRSSEPASSQPRITVIAEADRAQSAGRGKNAGGGGDSAAAGASASQPASAPADQEEQDYLDEEFEDIDEIELADDKNRAPLPKEKDKEKEKDRRSRHRSSKKLASEEKRPSSRSHSTRKKEKRKAPEKPAVVPTLNLAKTQGLPPS